MTRSSMFTLAYALMLGGAGPLAACVSHPASTEHGTAARSSALAESHLNNDGSVAATTSAAPAASEPAAPAPAQTAMATPPPAPAAVPTTFTDAQLQSFVAASAAIDPLNRQFASATPEQRTALGAQIRTALEQHNLDLPTYNAIAARAQTDQALGQRIAQLRATPPANAG